MDMMEKLTAKYKADYPEEFAGINIFSVNATEFDGIRPSTKDTIRTFNQLYGVKLAESKNREPVNLLVISSQPHTKYQEEVLKGQLDEEIYKIDVIGKESSDCKKVFICLDAFARSFYAFKERVNERELNRNNSNVPNIARDNNRLSK
jgi:hypothetical protein